MPSSTRHFVHRLATAALLAVGSAAYAVTPEKFTQTTEADFADGDAYGTVVTNLGDIKLSSQITPIEGLPEEVTVIHDVVQTRDGVYIAAGPEAKILLLRGGQLTTVKSYEGEQVFSMQALGNDVMVGVSGTNGARIELIDGGEMTILAQLPDANYIWDITWIDDAIAGTDTFVFATGPKGKVYTLSEEEGAKPKLLLETSQANVLSLASDRKGNVFAGTDTEGLVYRIDPKGKPFVVYDAPEAEVAALAVTEDGAVYAGTAAVDQAKPGRLAQPKKVEEGRPDAPEPDLEPKPEELDASDEAAAPVEPGAPNGVDSPDAAEQQSSEVDADAQAADDAVADVKPAPPTAEQYDQLRQAMRERLDAAREGGQFDAALPQAGGAAATPNRTSRAKPAAPAAAKSGNAIYRIAPDGFVSEVFRESAMILAISIQDDGKLIVATGNEGQVYAVDPAQRETTVLADLDSAQVTSATPTDSGLLLGASNPGALLQMQSAVAKQGGYTSKVLDASQVSMFGTFKLTADIPENTTVCIELRSGNVGDPEQGGWSDWSKSALLTHAPQANPLQPIETKIDVPPARYLQYRLTLTGDGESTPIIDQADLAYVAPNTPPTVAKLVIKPATAKQPGEDPDPKVSVTWQATDENKDRLLYSLEYKPGKADRYLPLAEDLTQPKYDWQTQHVPDGWYTVRLTAYDKLDNPPDAAKSGGRVSEPLLIDNTPPALEGLKAEILDGGKVKLTAKASDELSSIASVAYSIDGSDQYQASLPDDLIYDSTSEPWAVTISDLSPGGHVIAVRAIDARGNTAYRQLIVEVE